jgi:hypothetical protein
MEPAEKVRENNARRRLQRQGYRLSKSRRRDPLALDHGEYVITNARGQAPRTRVVFKSLDAVERWTAGDR